MAVTDPRRRLARGLMPVGVLVGAVHGDRGRVVAQLRAVDLELSDHAEHQLGQKRGAVGQEQAIQRAADLIVSEQPDLLGAQLQQRRIER